MYTQRKAWSTNGLLIKMTMAYISVSHCFLAGPHSPTIANNRQICHVVTKLYLNLNTLLEERQVAIPLDHKSLNYSLLDFAPAALTPSICHKKFTL